MKFLATTLVCLFLIPSASTFAQASDWDKLKRLSRGSKIELVETQTGSVSGQLVSIDEHGLTVRRTGSGTGTTETIAREDVEKVTVKRPNLKAIAIVAGVGSVMGTLVGGARCRGGTDYVGSYPYGSTVCRQPHGFYFDKTGAKIGASAGAALGLLGFAFPEKKILFRRSPIFHGKSAVPESSGSASPWAASDKETEIDDLSSAKPADARAEIGSGATGSGDPQPEPRRLQ